MSAAPSASTPAPTALDEPPRVLVVEDDADLAALLRLHLEDAGLDVEAVADGALALQRALVGGYGLVVLDLMLPSLEGEEVCRRLRAAGQTVPVLMLSARGSEDDRVAGLEIGADDYVAKPFSVREVVARARALLRRVDMDRPPADPDETLGTARLVIRPHRHEVALDGAAVDLTAKELDLLVHLARQPGRTFSRQDLLDVVWGVQYVGYAHTVNTHVNRLRAKVEPDPARPLFVQTVWGVGYRFAADADV